MPPTDVTASAIAQLNDTCGNLMQWAASCAFARSALDSRPARRGGVAPQAAQLAQAMFQFTQLRW